MYLSDLQMTARAVDVHKAHSRQHSFILGGRGGADTNYPLPGIWPSINLPNSLGHRVPTATEQETGHRTSELHQDPNTYPSNSK